MLQSLEPQQGNLIWRGEGRGGEGRQRKRQRQPERGKERENIIWAGGWER